MDYEVTISKETKRGCGFRKPDKTGVGIYLMGPSTTEACERLPWPLKVCPACGEGVRKGRYARWIDPKQLFNRAIKPYCDPNKPGHIHQLCPVCNPREAKSIIMWVGEKHYRIPGSFMAEAAAMGISKKVAHIPKDFDIGVHGLFLCHVRAVLVPDAEPEPGVFTYFKPTHVDLVIKPMLYEAYPVSEYNIPDRAKKIKDKLGDKARIVVVEPITEKEN